MALRVVDLFAGTGCFSLAFQKNSEKFEVVFANDSCPNSEKIYNKNFTHKLVRKSIHEIESEDIPPHDVLCAGFPCQPFSVAGKQLGFKDERSNVFWKLVEILKRHRPRIIILENVKNLRSHDKGNTFTIIKENLEEAGYKLHHTNLNVCKVTRIPQNRERIFIVGFLDKEDFDNFNFDFEIKKTKPVIDYLEEEVYEKYYYSDRYSCWDVLQKEIVDHIETDTVYQYRRYYVRENKNGLVPTLTANSGSGGHNVPLILDDVGIRKLTPRECFNLQGFPKSYKLPKELSDSALYKLAGNAICYQVAKLIVKKIDILVGND